MIASGWGVHDKKMDMIGNGLMEEPGPIRTGVLNSPVIGQVKTVQHFGLIHGPVLNAVRRFHRSPLSAGVLLQ